jgi:malic enzyme
MLWSEGCAIMATGSPFDPVTVAGRERVIGQANNVYVFPGVGMGAIISGAQIITDEMFAVAAKTLAERVSWVRLESGALYPPLSDLRSVSHDIALAVAHEAVASGVAEARSDGELEAKLETTLWVPEYGRSDSKWG